MSIFNRLKSIDSLASEAENHELIKACDLDRKIGARVSSLSGGQMSEYHQIIILFSAQIKFLLGKLQLCLMFTGGSRVCLVGALFSYV